MGIPRWSTSVRTSVTCVRKVSYDEISLTFDKISDLANHVIADENLTADLSTRGFNSSQRNKATGESKSQENSPQLAENM